MLLLMMMMMGLLLNILTFPSSGFSILLVFFLLILLVPIPAKFPLQNADNVFSLYYIYFDSHRIGPLSSANAVEFFVCTL